MTKEKEEEREIDRLWWNGYQLLKTASYHDNGLSSHFLGMWENGFDYESIAAAFAVPVNDVISDIEIYNEGKKMMAEAGTRAKVWVAKNGPSVILAGCGEKL